MKGIKSSKETFVHHVSWFSKAYLLERLSHIVPVIATIKKFPTSADEKISLLITSIEGDLLHYTPKITKNHLVLYDSVAAAKNAHDKNEKFSWEKEWRITVNTSDFFEPYSGNGLYHLVRHLEIQVPNLRDFCELIN